MTPRTSRISATLACAAALSMLATPAMARGHGNSWGGGWGGGWGKHRHHHGDGIDGGDVLAGLLVIGGIAAIASAASKAEKDRRARDDAADPRPEAPSRYGDAPARNDQPGTGSGSIDAAVDTCVAELERGDRRISSVDAVDRDGDGWRVAGKLGQRDFACAVSGEGRVRSVTVDGRADY